MRQPFSRAVATASVRVTHAALDTVFPPACRLCRAVIEPNSDFCSACERALTISEPWMRNACIRCGFPRKSGPMNVQNAGLPHLPAAVSQPTDSQVSTTPDETGVWTDSAGQQVSCAQCRVRNFRFASVFALWIYKDRVRDAVVASKYASHAALADALGTRLGRRILADSSNLPDWVTFVPSHWLRQMARGGNGGQVIAAAVSRVIRRPCYPLARLKRPISKQAWLNDQKREQNLRGAFMIKKSYAWSRARALAGRHVLVVDDVLTTGATANEMAIVLERAGARRVSLAVVARAVRMS